MYSKQIFKTGIIPIEYFLNGNFNHIVKYDSYDLTRGSNILILHVIQHSKNLCRSERAITLGYCCVQLISSFIYQSTVKYFKGKGRWVQQSYLFRNVADIRFTKITQSIKNHRLCQITLMNKQKISKGPLQRAFSRCFGKSSKEEPETANMPIQQRPLKSKEKKGNTTEDVSSDTDKSTKRSNIDSEDLVGLDKITDNYQMYKEKFKAKVKSSPDSKDYRLISSTKYKQIPTSVQAKILAPTMQQPQDKYQLERLVAQHYTNHGYNYYRFKEQTSLPIQKAQYIRLLKDVLRNTFEVMIRLYRRYEQFRGKMVGWSQDWSIQMLHAGRWMGAASLGQLNKLINYVYRLRKQVVSQVSVSNLYECIKSHWLKKFKRDLVTVKHQQINKLSKIKVEEDMPVVKKEKSQKVKKVNSSTIAKEIAQLFVVYKNEDLVEDKISNRHDNVNWTRILISIVLDNQAKAGLELLVQSAHTLSLKDSTLSKLQLSSEDINNFIGILQNEQLKATLIQYSLSPLPFHDAVSRLITEVNRQLRIMNYRTN